MWKQIEGSKAIAEAITLCRPEVISCYPITPQTHIVEALSSKAREGALGSCEYVNVESEFAALSVLIGSSAVGARSYTATSSQGLLFMAEAVYNASGLGLPIVMTIGNRAIGAPINIWNDHSDSMALRDAGWIQLYAESNQEALDLHIQAFRLAESLECPVMVCVDGFVLTHACERVDMPSQAEVDQFLPDYEPSQILDPDEPMTIGTMVGPDAFFEVRYLAHQKHLKALEHIPSIQQQFYKLTGRLSGGLIESYRTEDAALVLVAMGSLVGTLKDVVDELRETGLKVGCLKIVSFRPFPFDQIRTALQQAKTIMVLEKNLAIGQGGVLSQHIHRALRKLDINVHTVIAGLGGRPVGRQSVRNLVSKLLDEGELEEPYLLDLNWPIIENELARQREQRRSGPIAENIVRDIGLREAVYHD